MIFIIYVVCTICECGESLSIFSTIVLVFEEDSIQVIVLPSSETLYRVINYFEGRKRTTILVTRQKSEKIDSPEDVIGIITAQDLAEIYGMVD